MTPLYLLRHGTTVVVGSMTRVVLELEELLLTSKYTNQKVAYEIFRVECAALTPDETAAFRDAIATIGDI